MRFLRNLAIFIVIVVVIIFGLRLIFALPDNDNRSESTHTALSADTYLGRGVLGMMEDSPGVSGVLPLADGRDALAARILMARTAQESIDTQYYIWETDTTGWALLDEYLDAAERGVRIRLLLDDNGIPGLDQELAALDSLPNVEVRLWNPYQTRWWKQFAYAFDFFRLNRRMHNKSMTADGAATIIGGRNIGDVYFDYGEGAHHFDYDVLAAGPAATIVGETFDDYWASESAYPIGSVVNLKSAEAGLQSIRDHGEAARHSARGEEYVEAMQNSPIMSQVIAGESPHEWTTVTLYVDDPSKGLGLAADDQLLIASLPDILNTADTSLDLVSAYFIPGALGAETLIDLANKGVKIRILTNSLESNNVSSVHSAYLKYRDDLVDAGIELHELRAEPDAAPESFVSSILSGSTASLHAKTFSIDDQDSFIGSFNFDPRSAHLNTEMGFLIDSPSIASALTEALNSTTNSYYVVRGPDGNLLWQEKDADGNVTVTYDHDPNTSIFKRGLVRVMSWLPIEWVL